MLDLKAALITRLTGDSTLSNLVGRKIHWSVVPQGTALPYVRLQIIADARPGHLKGYNATRQTFVQADCMASTSLTADQIAHAIKDALQEPRGDFGRTHARGPEDRGEDTTAEFVHRSMLELQISHRFK